MVNLETSVGSGGRPDPDKQFAFRARQGPDRARRGRCRRRHDRQQPRHGLRAPPACSRHPRGGRDAHLRVLGARWRRRRRLRPAARRRTGCRPRCHIAATDPTADETGVGGHRLPAGPGVGQGPRPPARADSAGEADGRVVVVFLHWGIQERVQCPTARQGSLAAALAKAGADVVVGSHAHVLQPTAEVDGGYVAYGLGNYVWYTPTSGPTADAGVLTLTVQPAIVTGPERDRDRHGVGAGADRGRRAARLTAGRPAQDFGPTWPRCGSVRASLGDTSWLSGARPRRPRGPLELGGVDDGRDVVRRVVAGVRRAAEPDAGQPLAARTTSGRWTSGGSRSRPARPAAGRALQLVAERVARRLDAARSGPRRRRRPGRARPCRAGTGARRPRARRRRPSSRSGGRRRSARAAPPSRTRPGPPAAGSDGRPAPRPSRAARRCRTRCPRRRAPAGRCRGARRRAATARRAPHRRGWRPGSRTARPDGQTPVPGDENPAGVWNRCRSTVHRARSTATLDPAGGSGVRRRRAGRGPIRPARCRTASIAVPHPDVVRDPRTGAAEGAAVAAGRGGWVSGPAVRWRPAPPAGPARARPRCSPRPAPGRPPRSQARPHPLDRT